MKYLKFLLLNLMPHKLQTEVQFARILGASPLQIELTLMTTETYTPKNTEKDHLLAFYKNLDEIKHNFYDIYCFQLTFDKRLMWGSSSCSIVVSEVKQTIQTFFNLR